MELACIAKLGRSPNTFRLQWKSYDSENIDLVTEDRTLDVRLLNSETWAKIKTRKRARTEERSGFSDGKEYGVECKSWHENNRKKRLVFIGGEAILTDQEVVVYEIEDEVGERENSVAQPTNSIEENDDEPIFISEEIKEKTLSHKSDLKSHLATHREPEGYYCDKCDIKVSHDRLDAHLKRHGVCKYCNKKWSSKKSLKYHCMTKHLAAYLAEQKEIKVRKFKCPDCEEE